MRKTHEILRDLRHEHGIKQTAVAYYLNISQQAYSNYESGRHEVPVWAVVALSKYYKVSTDYLLGADTSYLGGTNLSDNYIGDLTMYDIIYEIQRLKRGKRRELVRYIRYLKSIRHLE